MGLNCVLRGSREKGNKGRGGGVEGSWGGGARYDDLGRGWGGGRLGGGGARGETRQIFDRLKYCIQHREEFLDAVETFTARREAAKEIADSFVCNM